MHIVHVCSFGINRGCKYAAHMYSCNLKPEQHRITQSSVSILKFLYKKYSFVPACNRWDKLPWLNISIAMIYCNNEDKIFDKLLKAICNFEILNRIILKKLWFLWSTFLPRLFKDMCRISNKTSGVYVHINVPIKGVLFKKPIIFLLV